MSTKNTTDTKRSEAKRTHQLTQRIFGSLASSSTNSRDRDGTYLLIGPMRAFRSSLSCSQLLYTLGNDLYVPLTSRCNALTLPQTRGPKFTLPTRVVAALCRVRDVECGVEQWRYWCNYLDTQDEDAPLPLPPPKYGAIAELSDETEYEASEGKPEVSELMDQIKSAASIELPKSIVVAGEGEPLLRRDDLLELVQAIKATDELKDIPVRLTTNGLAYDGSDIVRQLHQCGIQKVSVALMTGDAQQYNELMEPANGDGAHDRVCNFISKSLRVGLQVETTGVDRVEVNKAEAEELSKSLGVTSPMRWRPYFE